MDNLVGLSAGELLVGYRERLFSPVEVVEALAGRIEDLNPQLGAMSVFPRPDPGYTGLPVDRGAEPA